MNLLDFYAPEICDDDPTIIITKFMNIYIESINDSEESTRVEIFLSLLIRALSWTDKNFVYHLSDVSVSDVLEHLKQIGVDSLN
jgi:hypothetical protein